MKKIYLDKTPMAAHLFFMILTYLNNNIMAVVPPEDYR